MYKKKFKGMRKEKDEREIRTRIWKDTTTILEDIDIAISHLTIEIKQTPLNELSERIKKQERKQKDVSTYFRFIALFLKYIPTDGSISKIRVMSDLAKISVLLKVLKTSIENPNKLKKSLKMFYEYFLPIHTAKKDEILSILFNPTIEEFWEIQSLFSKIPSGFNGKLSDTPSGIDPTQSLLVDNFLQLFVSTNSFELVSGLEVPHIKQNEIFSYKKQLGSLQREKFQELLEEIGFEFRNGQILPDMVFWKDFQIHNLVSIDRSTSGQPKAHFNFSDQTLYQVYLSQVLVKRRFTPELMSWFAIILAWLILLFQWYSKLSEKNLFENLFEEKFFSRMFICRFAKSIALAEFGLQNAILIRCGKLQMNDQVFDAATSKLIELKLLVEQFIKKRPEIDLTDENVTKRIDVFFADFLFPLVQNPNQRSFLEHLKRNYKNYFSGDQNKEVNVLDLIEDVKSYLITNIKEAENNRYIDSKFGLKLREKISNLNY